MRRLCAALVAALVLAACAPGPPPSSPAAAGPGHGHGRGGAGAAAGAMRGRGGGAPAMPTAAGAAGATAVAAPASTERPTYQVGEKWIRNDGAYELLRIEGDLYVFSAGPNLEVRLSRDLGFARMQRGRQFHEFDPPLPLRWPLAVGQWGSGTTRWRSHNWRSPEIASVTWKVEAYEEIFAAGARVPAYRIEIALRQTSGVNSRVGAVNLWYSPEHRQIVRLQTDEVGGSGFQVIAFDDGRGEAPLRITLGEPADQAELKAAQVLLRGSVAAGRGVGRIEVSRNGEVVSALEPLGAAKDVPLDVRVPLQPGRNVLLVTATEAGGREVRQEARTVHYGAPPAATPSPGPAPGPAPPPAPAPLRLAIAAPAEGQTVAQETVAVAATASAGRGVRRVVVSVNGVEAGRLEPAAPAAVLPVNLPLPLREGANTVVLTATDGDGHVHQEIRTVTLEKTVPLTVSFRYPEDRAVVTEASSVAAAVVTSSRGVARVSVLLNGAEVHQQSERAAPRSALVTVPLTLRDGPNTVAITATDGDGGTRQEVRTVTYRAAAAPAPVAAPPPRPAPDRWAVIIGVGRYDHAAIPGLSYSVRDADAIYRVLTGPGGLKKEHVLLLTDATERKPTLKNVKWALGTFLARSARKDDTVLIYFAGHGAPEVDQRGLERDGLSKYLVPSDAEPDDLYSSALPMDELQTIFARLEAERVVVFLDACYSGAAGGRTFASKKMRAGSVDDLFLERLTRSKGRAIVTAARPAEVSLESSDLGHGIFTYYLIRGLEGAADTNRDGIVSLQELYEYVEQQVTAKSRSLGGNQHPVMKGELEGPLPLVKVGGK